MGEECRGLRHVVQKSYPLPPSLVAMLAAPSDLELGSLGIA